MLLEQYAFKMCSWSIVHWNMLIQICYWSISNLEYCFTFSCSRIVCSLSSWSCSRCSLNIIQGKNLTEAFRSPNLLPSSFRDGKTDMKILKFTKILSLLHLFSAPCSFEAFSHKYFRVFHENSLSWFENCRHSKFGCHLFFTLLCNTITSTEVPFFFQ